MVVFACAVNKTATNRRINICSYPCCYVEYTNIVVILLVTYGIVNICEWSLLITKVVISFPYRIIVRIDLHLLVEPLPIVYLSLIIKHKMPFSKEWSNHLIMNENFSQQTQRIVNLECTRPVNMYT